MYRTDAEERRIDDARKYGTSGGMNYPVTINYPKGHKNHVPGTNYYRGEPKDYEGWAPRKQEPTPAPVCTSGYCLVCHPDNIMLPGSIGEQLQKRTRHVE